MRKAYFITGLLCYCVGIGFSANGQNLLLSETFNSPGGPFILNWGGWNGNLPNTGANAWVVNNQYAPSAPYAASTALQNITSGGVINGAPSSNYLHITDPAAANQNAVYDPSAAGERWAVMFQDVCTRGMAGTEFKFFWIGGGSPGDYAEIYYSANGGNTYNLCTSTSGRTQYNGNTAQWQYEIIAMPQFDDQTQLSFAIRWVTSGTSGIPQAGAVSFGIDDIFITAFNGPAANLPVISLDLGGVAEVCPNTALLVGFVHSSPLCDGIYSVELSLPGGAFPAAPQYLEFTNAQGTQNFGVITDVFAFQTLDTALFYVLMPASLVTGVNYRLRLERRPISPPAIAGSPNAPASNPILVITCPDSIKIGEPVVLSNPNDTICVSSVIDVPFNSEGVFGLGNQYICQLSDASGSFANPQVVGTLGSSAAFPDPMEPGQISGIMPIVPAGCGYFLRVVSTNPSVPPTVATTFGPFCIKQCDIETNDILDVLACISRTAGDTALLQIDINSWGPGTTYGGGNQFQAQILNSQFFTVVNTGGLGVTAGATSGTLDLVVPRGPELALLLTGDSTANPTGLYYLRIVATQPSNPAHAAGTLVRLRVGWPQANLQVFVSGGDSVFCAGQGGNIDFFASPYNSNQPPISNMLWTVNGNTTTLPSWSVQLTVTNPGVFNVTVQEDHNGCLGPVSSVRTATAIVAPNLATVDTSRNACLGNISTYTVPFNNFTAYTWNFNPNLNVVSQGNNAITLNWDTLGVFPLTISASNQCGNSINTINVAVNPIPDVAMPPDTLICLGETFAVTPIVDPAGQNYIWFRNGSQVQGQTGPTLNITGTSANASDTIRVFYGTTLTGCYGEDTAIVQTGPALVLNSTADTAVCPRTPSRMFASGADAYAWAPPALFNFPDSASPLLRADDTVVVSVTGVFVIGNDKTCTQTRSFTVAMLQPTPTNQPALNLCPADPAVTLATDATGLYHTWSTGDTTPSIQAAAVGAYTVVFFSPVQGCVAQRFSVEAIDCPEEPADTLLPAITVPNVFTPNADGVNDNFLPRYVDIEKVELAVFDRWGNLVFSTTRLAEAWNGNTQTGGEAAPGVYFWRLRATALTGAEVERAGQVTLLR